MLKMLKKVKWQKDVVLLAKRKWQSTEMKAQISKSAEQMFALIMACGALDMRMYELSKRIGLKISLFL